MRASLRRDETGYRLSDVEAQYQSTFEWIFDKERANYTTWLEALGPIFWVSGKPGSGKSTIMKMVREDRRTVELFKAQKPDAVPVIVDYFFHNRGSSIQMSLEGLLYRILYQMTSTATDIARMLLPVFKSRPKEDGREWTLRHLREALEVILAQSRIPLRILVFFDALDEFDGEPRAIADFVQDLGTQRKGSTTEVKVCCSSRPWTAFQDAFSDSDGCRVHEHTHEDIRRYINGRVSENTRMTQMMKGGPQANGYSVQRLIRKLPNRANGVFVWVRLVLDELLRACSDGATPGELAEILSTIPGDLDEVYQRSVDRIPLKYRFDAYVMIETVLRFPATIALRDLGLVVLCAPGISPSDCAKYIPADPCSHDFILTTARRLQSRCGGILEVTGRDNAPSVSFMHQTAKDFFSRPGSTEGILHQEPTRALENGYSFLAKSVLTIASLSSRSFDYLSFSLYDLFNVHYSSPFGPYMHKPSQRLCAHYAYLAEVSTGRSQREFLDRVSDRTIEKFFEFEEHSSTLEVKMEFAAHYITTTRRHVTYINEPLTTKTTFSKAAGLRLYLKEKGQLEDHARLRDHAGLIEQAELEEQEGLEEQAQLDKQQRLRGKARTKQQNKRLKRKSRWQLFLKYLLNI